LVVKVVNERGTISRAVAIEVRARVLRLLITEQYKDQQVELVQ